MLRKSKIINTVKNGNKPIPIGLIKEPYNEEIKRIRFEDFSSAAIDYAYKIESIERLNKTGQKLNTDKHERPTKINNMFYSRYVAPKDSSSVGLLTTNIDMNRLAKDNGNPRLVQMGPTRRRLALAQRALYFDDNQNKGIHKIITKYEKGKIKIPPRSNTRNRTIDAALGITKSSKVPTGTPALIEIGYKKISSEKILSRRVVLKNGLFNVVGKYTRKIIGLGAMPPVSGWRDTLVIAALGHMICFIPRSSIYVTNIDLRVRLARSVSEVIEGLKMPSLWKNRVIRNIGAALGAGNPKAEVKIAKKLYKSSNIKNFRIYTIGSDRRVIDTAELLRQTFGNEIEIFVGQVADKAQAKKLISKNIKVDGLILGHGGGQQCTSAINGMAITTVEDVYELILDKSFNKTSIIVEGGLSKSIGTALIMGIDCGLGNQKLVRGVIETGDLFTIDKRGKICQPYPGTASPVTQIIESEDENHRMQKIDSAGRTYYSEGKPGFMYFEAKANSMAFWVNEYLRYAARTLTDLGVENISELRMLLKNNNINFLRIMSDKAQYLSEPH